MKLPVMGPDTLVPLSVIAVLMGGVFWLSTLYSQTLQNTRNIEDIQNTLSHWAEARENIVDRLARIEQKLDMLTRDSYDETNNQKRRK